MKYLLLYFLLIATTVFAQSPKRADVNNSTMNANIFYDLLLAELARIDDRAPETFTAYLELARKTPTDQLFERATRIPLETRDRNKARQVALEWAQTLPTSALAQNYLFQINYAQKQYADALPPLRQFLALTPEADRAAAIIGLTRYFFALKDKQAAANELIKILTPYIVSTSSTLATKAAARLTMSRSQIEAGRFNDALVQLRLLTSESPATIDGWLLQGALELQENQFGLAEKSFQQFLVLAPKIYLASNHASYVQTYLGLAQLAENRKDYAAAQNWLSKIEDEKERLAAQYRRASITARLGKMNEARDLIQQLPEQTTAQARAKLIAEVSLIRDYGQLQDAIQLLNKALIDAPQDADLTYELSTIYAKAQNYEAMEATLRKVIALRPKSSIAYNALGYSLANRGLRLDEAKALIERALTITPDDPYMVDSFAWTLYRMGRLDESLAILQIAYKIRADAEIGAHKGEVLWQLNRRFEALQTWREAQAIDADNPTLFETLKRLGVRL